MKRTLLSLTGIILCLTFSLPAYAGIPVNLRCEYLTEPIGIDTDSPRLTWEIRSEKDGTSQTAYRLIIDTDPLNIEKGTGTFYDSGIIKSDKQRIEYNGKKLQPCTRYYWNITYWDENGTKSESSETSYFETGLKNTSWRGNWISDNRSIDFKPAPYFRKAFNINKKIKSARAYIAVAGLYELSLNGEKVGDHRLDPLYTRFDRKNFYVTYDVTPQLSKGENVIGVLLGNGWYNHQSIAVWNFDKAPWRNRPAFCLDLRITYTDGTTEVIASGLDWKTSSGALIFNSIYTAEHYDARLEQKGWDKPGFDDSKWHHVGYRGAPSPRIVSQQVQPIRNVKEYTAKNIKKLNDTTYLYDFGQNMAGVTRLRTAGKAGTEIRLIHGERLGKNGHVDLSNIDVYHRPKDKTDPFQTDIVILSGNGTDEFMPRFNYKGFRYVEVVGTEPLQLDTASLKAYFMHSDVSPMGRVYGSNPIIEQLWQATNNAYCSNLMGYPTDCPQREKNGWTGDGHFAIETALYNYDGITVYEKWLADHRDEQQPNGVLPDIIPTGGWGYGTANGVDWTSTIAIIPWNIYLFYGDDRLLKECYDNIKRYVDYIDNTYPSGLTSWGRGDWVPVKSHSSLELTSSVYYFIDATILAKAAAMFGKPEDEAHYKTLAEKIRRAINHKYLNEETGIYANGTQTELSVPLFWGVVPENLKEKVAENLAKKVRESDFHLDVGVLGAKAILSALSDNGQAETAYKIAVQKTYPSWGWWVVNGATTLLENWDLNATRDISDNHMMFGEIGGWFFKGLGGIKPDPENPGFKNIILQPNFIKDLPSFYSEHRTPYGLIVSKWTRKKNKINYTVEIPANCTATLLLPNDESPRILNSGKHSVTIKNK